MAVHSSHMVRTRVSKLEAILLKQMVQAEVVDEVQVREAEVVEVGVAVVSKIAATQVASSWTGDLPNADSKCTLINSTSIASGVKGL